MDYIDTSISINEKSSSSSEINLTQKNKKIFPKKENDTIDINTKKILKTKKEFNIPSNLKGTFKFIIALTIIGIFLIFCGILKAIINKNIFGGIMFWILALLVLIPGGFYSYQFYKAKKAKTEIERREIFDKIPKLKNSIIF